MADVDRWVSFLESPPEPGWYPVMRCWDQEEGSFPGGAFWNGSEWSSGAVIEYLPERYETRYEAELNAAAADKI